MRLKTMCALAVAVTVAVLAVISAPVSANETDDRIASAFKNSYVYKTYLNDEQIEISVEDGDVMLSGDVSTIAHKSLAQDTAEALPGLRASPITLRQQSKAPTGTPMHGSA